MNQPPGGGYPPGPRYPGQPGLPQQGYPQQPAQSAQPQVGQPGAAKPMMGTMLMNDAPPRPGMPQPAPQMPPQGYGQPVVAQPGFAQPALPQVAGSPVGYGQAPAQAPYGAPPAYGAQAPMPGYGQQAAMPQPQNQSGGGVNMPQLAVGGVGAYGMPKIGLQGGDFSPTKLMTAVVSGQGFRSPRKMGLIMIGLAVLFGIGNFVVAVVTHRYYPYLYSVGAIFGWTGLWLLITGQPRAKEDGSKAPMWSRIGLAAFFAIGVLVGGFLCVFNWEANVVDSALGN